MDASYLGADDLYWRGAQGLGFVGKASVSGTGSASLQTMTEEELAATEKRRKPIGFDPPAKPKPKRRRRGG